MADLQFILFGFSCFAYVERISLLLVWSNPNRSNRRSAVILTPMQLCSLDSLKIRTIV